MRFYFLIISLGLTTPSNGQQNFLDRFKDEANSRAIPDRLIETMKSYNDDALSRAAGMKTERFMYEVSPHYQKGYVFSEIIERYRKMVDIAKRSSYFKSTTLFEAVKYVELIQKLYFEVYHLLNMMHEIPRKFENVPEFSKGLGEVFDMNKILAAEEAMRDRDERRRKEQKRLKKFYKKMREARMKVGDATPVYISKPYNLIWPRDYGWEVDEDYMQWPHLMGK